MSTYDHVSGTTVQRRNPDATDEWWTPKWILDALPPFDLDPCAPVGGPLYRHCPLWWTKLDDGLSKPWFGHVWLNPPYSAPLAWMKRMADHGDGVALIFARTETRWWQDHVFGHADQVLFVRSRIKFVKPDGTVGATAPAPSALCGYGDWAVEALRSAVDRGFIPGHLVRLA